MPRLADHEQRRREITTASRRVIARSGIDAATFQTVAAEAAMSVRLLQYYFGNKRELLMATHRCVVAEVLAQLERGSAEMPGCPSKALHTIVMDLLPLDEQRRQDALVLAAFRAGALVETGVEDDTSLLIARALEAVVLERLQGAHQLAITAACPDDIVRDARLIVFAVEGFTGGILTNELSGHSAEALVERLIQHVVPPRADRSGTDRISEVSSGRRLLPGGGTWVPSMTQMS